MKHSAILLLIPVLGACAATPRAEPQDRQPDLAARYVYVLEREARRGFKSIHWVTLPTHAQIAQRIGSPEDGAGASGADP